MPRYTPRPRPCTSRTSCSPAWPAASTYSATTDGMSRGRKLCKSSSASIGMWIGRSDIARRHHRLDPAAHGEIADDRHAARAACLDEVVENLIGHVLVVDPAVAELDDVVLERFELDAARIGRV